ncbi:MAG: DUF167 domain-containing protein [Spirochaetia bacterium]|nr:DUF167 domain-containing protein [Spirochaetia bacterium]
MKIQVTVKPGSKKPGVEKNPDGSYVLRVRERAQEGKANQAVIEAMAEVLGVPKSRLQIVRGETARQKTLELI